MSNDLQLTDEQLAGVMRDGEIACFLLPLLGITALVPTVSVAEMAPLTQLAPIEDSPDWLVGMYEWRNINVPVLSYEVLNGVAELAVNTQGRIAVFNNTGVDERVPFVAIYTQGIPRMTRVGEKDIQEDPNGTKGEFDLMCITVGVEEFNIPDIPGMEMLYAKYLDS